MSRKTESWREVFERARVIPPHSQTVRQAQEAHLTASHGFQILLNRVTGPHIQQVISEVDRSVTYQLRVTLFDRNHLHFFGKTWKSSHQRMKSNHKIQFNEIMYLHTSLRVPAIVAVVELVALSDRPDGSQHALGCGFAVLEMFAGKGEEHASAGGDRRLILHHGTPRELLHPKLKGAVEYGSLLKAIDGAHVECVVKGHPALGSVVHLLPENMLVSGQDNIPGLVPSPTGDALLRPKLLKRTPYCLSRLTVSLQPSLDHFESQLVQLVSADWDATAGVEGPTRPGVVVQERRLHVGVHNGWGFLEEPQVVLLELQVPSVGGGGGGKGRGDGTARQATLTKDGKALASLPGTLGLRSSLELQLANHSALAVVFQLEYVFSAPLGRDNTLSATSTSRAAFMHCLRWAAWCPFQEASELGEEQAETQLPLLGGPRPNPFEVMVYRETPPSMPPVPGSATAPGNTQVNDKADMLRFRLWSRSDRKVSSPKVSVRNKHQGDTQRQRILPSSSPPSKGRKPIPHSGSPESPRGQALSLSQLAAASPRPTGSRSAAALPWQQSFPSPLDPSLLASAHQLSHAGDPAAYSMAHLEMDLQRDGDDAASPLAIQDGDPLLQELPFTPLHAPVLTLETYRPSSRPVGSRSSLAHLYSAGFPDILDRDGQAALVLDPMDPVHYDPGREDADPLQGNLLVFQFLAFSRVFTADADADWPESVHFTFQFYRFPPVTSQRLTLQPAHQGAPPQPAGHPLPCVLSPVHHDTAVNPGGPGLQVQFRVDEGFLKAGERRWFLGYLAQQTLQVDVWDSASLLLVGSSCIPLKYMLRQGRSAVQALHELEVLATEYSSEETPLHLSGEPGQYLGSGAHHHSLVNINTVLRGRLYVRTGNIGCLVDPNWRRTGEVPPPCSHVITQRDGGAGGFRGGKLSTGNILRLNERNASLAQRAAMAVDITDGGPEVIKDGVGPPVSGESAEDRQRKLSCLAAVLQREAREHPESQVKTARVMSRREERVQLVRDLGQIRALQDRSKAEAIASMLSQAITTRHALYVSLGTAEYMEFVLRNPFSAPHTVSIHSSDPDLSVISSVEEWSHFKALTQSPTPVENLFLVEEGSPDPRVYLRPRESVHIPLKYQSFVCDHSPPLQGPGFPSSGRQEDVARKHASNIVRAKSIKVTFRAEDGQPLAVLQVDVEPTPHLVAHTFRLYHPQLCLLKKALRIPPWQASAPVGSPDGGEEEISVRCSDPSIVCQTKMLAPGEPQDVYMKVPGSPSPDVKMFYIMLFTDRWLARPASIWRVYVHFLERVEVSCVAGQRTLQSLVLRGTRAARKVRCYCSHPRLLEVDPAGVFVLPPAGAVLELQVRVQPWRSGARLAFVSAVDMERCQLLAAWMICLNAHRPVLSKAFEVPVPVGGGRGSTRRITYTNPYPDTRTFLLHSDRPDLLQFKEDRFQVGGGEVYTIGLRFAPSQSGGSTEISIYINNLDEKTEETFALKVNYS
ncbi:unnamed protein product [Lota lota]